MIFDIGWSEMAIIMLVALIVIGPKDLPRVARTLGHWVGKGRALARDFQRQLEDMAREAELDEVKKEIEKVGQTDLKRSIAKTVDPDNEIGGAFDVEPRREQPGARPAPSTVGKAGDAEGDEAAAKPEPGRKQANGAASPAAPPEKVSAGPG